MSFDGFMVVPLTVFNLAAGSVDRYDNEVPTFDAGTSVMGWVAPSAVNENTVDRETRLSEFDVALQPDVVVDATSRIEYEGRTHEVIGRPREARTPLGVHHLELVMRVVEG